jgi:saccharopine dehydrogenase-like NADP-dependent oxidoreductase
VADFVAGIVPSVKQENIVAAVRSEEQAKAIVDTGVKAIRLDLSNADAVIDSIQAHDSKSRGVEN